MTTDGSAADLAEQIDNHRERNMQHTTNGGRRRLGRRWFGLLALVAVIGLLAGACSSDDDADSDDTETMEGSTIRIRGQDFSESATLAEVYGQYLEAKGFPVEVLTPAGFRTEAITALENDELDLIIDYIGGTQTELLPDTETSQDAAEVIAAITPALAEKGLTVLEPSDAVDGDALVVRGDSEAENISDLAGLDYSFGGSAQCFERPQCYLGLTDPAIYGITFSGTKTFEFGPLLGENLKAEEVDAVIWNDTAPEIEANGFKILTDDKGLFPAQNIAPIVRDDVLEEYAPELAEALDELSATITTEDLVAWNTSTDIDKEEPDDVAEDWLKANNLI